MHEQPVVDKAAVGLGVLASGAIGLQWIDTFLAVIVGLMTALLLGMRIYLSWREIRTGRKADGGEPT